MTESRFAAPLFVLLALASCEPRSGAASPRGAPTPSVTVLATTSTAAAEPAASDSPPLIIAPSDFERRDLEVQGYLPARLLSPNPRVPGAPVIVITHGAGGTPEAHCERYAEFVRPRAFLLCTRGVENNRHLPREERGYFYDGHHELGKELRAAIAALAAAEGPNVDTARALFFGYSQGASMGALALQEGENARGFVAALFVEGGTVDWNIALSKKIAEKGLRRVAMVCGQPS